MSAEQILDTESRVCFTGVMKTNTINPNAEWLAKLQEAARAMDQSTPGTTKHGIARSEFSRLENEMWATLGDVEGHVTWSALEQWDDSPERDDERELEQAGHDFDDPGWCCCGVCVSHAEDARERQILDRYNDEYGTTL